MRRDHCTQRKLIYLMGVLVMVFITTSAVASPVQPSDGKPVLSRMMQLRVPFVANEGQVSDLTVRYYTRTFGGNFYVRENGEMVYLLSSRPEDKDNEGLRMPGSPGEVKTTFFREMLVDANKTSVEARDPALTKVNSFIGNDRSKWKTNMATYSSVSLGEVYEGISLSIKAYGKRVEKVFTVQPGADLRAIRLNVEGSGPVKVNEQGELEVETGLGLVRFSKPVAYQERNGTRHDVQVAYVADGNAYGFKVAEYDRALPLVIDPVLTYGTYLGGTGDEEIFGIAVDATGSAFVTGRTLSIDFPTTSGAYQASNAGEWDAFVAKLDPSGSALVYCTYLGGAGVERADDIAVDGDGHAYVTGYTGSTDFPTVNAYQSSHGGDVADAFVTKLDASGSALVYSTYLGGSGIDEGFGIAVDGTGNAHVTGTTGSTNFPSVNAYQASYGGGVYDTFVTKLAWDPDETKLSLVYSTYLGGTDTDQTASIALDSLGGTYVAGLTRSTAFPTQNPIQPNKNGDSDAYVTKLVYDNTESTLSLAYSTYLGGTGGEAAFGIAVDGSGSAYVAGRTTSSNFPTQSPYQSANAGLRDVFVTKLNPSGSALVFSTYLGGTEGEIATSIAIDESGNAYVTGETFSADFPMQNALQDALKGTADVFVTKLNPSGSALVYSTYLGGTDGEIGQSIAVDGLGNAYVAGGTLSSDFPTRLDSYQPDLKGISDAFIVKLTEAGVPDHEPPAFTLISPTDGQVNVASPLTIQVRITDPSIVYFNAPECGNPTPNCYTDPRSIVLRLGNFLLNPISWDTTTDTLTFTDTDPPTMALPGQCYTATVEAHDLLKNPGSLSFHFRMADPASPDPPFGEADEVYPCTVPVFGSAPVCLKDTDLDGIPDDGVTLTDGTKTTDPTRQRVYSNEKTLYTTSESYLTTDETKRTLFIRPIKMTGTPEEPVFDVWQEFVDVHLPVVKVPFANRGIELKVVGPDFDPYTAVTPDPVNKPPVSIVEITYDLAKPGDATYFSSLSKTWFWGLLGLTPYDTSLCSNKTKYGYFKTFIFGNSVKRYLCDRQYDVLTAGTTMLQPAYQCGTSLLKSPMNFFNDVTVEFNPFVFDASGTIQAPVPVEPAAPFIENQVIQRLIAHEIGHTLLNASVSDHCSNPNCIMYGSLSSVTGWAMKEFGPGTGGSACTHTPGKTYDIRPRVLNKLNPTYVPANCPVQ